MKLKLNTGNIKVVTPDVNLIQNTRRGKLNLEITLPTITVIEGFDYTLNFSFH
jgi:hypothetical protein